MDTEQSKEREKLEEINRKIIEIHKNMEFQRGTIKEKQIGKKKIREFDQPLLDALRNYRLKLQQKMESEFKKNNLSVEELAKIEKRAAKAAHVLADKVKPHRAKLHTPVAFVISLDAQFAGQSTIDTIFRTQSVDEKTGEKKIGLMRKIERTNHLVSALDYLTKTQYYIARANAATTLKREKQRKRASSKAMKAKARKR